ncbi:citrate transporter family protein [Caenibius tardaugens NBRC 16725]|uniref:Citrate transporter family protein n=1 Tax=Caenibius tardaugens NBRC 16725 TaxID=1219035 RepID=U2Y804_9SPHN|nr:SLC13 family permease [Caenibius tardaugens]AZI36651.1 SLC13/DASS family transporter [Caenibius tardaugens NBRC 16725]GAD49306.1 citrate transporter family protein [Caenibius tardaugens NBRC 16725]
MTADQILTLVVLAAVVGMLIWDRLRADVVALAGSAVLLMTGVVRPVDVQGAFASPAIIALASLFVIVYALELSGLLDRAIILAVRMCRRLGAAGIWLMLTMIGSASCFLNSTPIVVLAAPVIRDVSNAMKLSPKRFLMPLSYITVLTGCCTLIGTSTNLIVDDMAAVAGQPRFGIFEITPVGLPMALLGGVYLYFFSGRLIRYQDEPDQAPVPSSFHMDETHIGNAQVGDAHVFEERRPLVPWKAWAALGTFAGAIVLATMNVAPIAATAFAGAVLLILLRVISADEAYRGLKPDILILIAGMVVIGIAIEQSGLAAQASDVLINSVHGLSPLVALVMLYIVTMVLTELLSNATVAVLVTPIAVALAESMGVSPRPFIVAVMMAASAAFATPFGYQTNVIVYQMAGYRYMDFVRMGLPLNVLTGAVAITAILVFFPF